MTNFTAGPRQPFLRRALRFAGRLSRGTRDRARLAAATRYAVLRPGRLARVGRFKVRLNDGPNLQLLYKDLFVRRVYHFDAVVPNPRILDCGSNIGMSILYFKSVYPAARIEAFEPDPVILPYLRENLRLNGLDDVSVHELAVGGREETLTFYSDAKYGSTLEAGAAEGDPSAWTRHEVRCVRLHDYLDQPVDLLKMNIEGAEYDAIRDATPRLRNVREMIIEYHHLPGLPRTLHEILTILHQQGFEYLIYDFDAQTNPGSQPPFRLGPDSRMFLLIYAKRIDAETSPSTSATR